MESGIYTNLSKLPMFESASVCFLPVKSNIRQRLLNLGMINGTEIMPVQSSPAGDPRAYLFRGSLIALRSSDANSIIVRRG